MCHHAGFWLGRAGWREGTRGCGAHAAAGGESGSVRSAVCVITVVLLLSILVLLLFPLFAVQLNCPYTDPPVFACFFPFSSPTQRGEGRPHGSFVAGHGQTITLNLAPKCGAGIMAGLSRVC